MTNSQAATASVSSRGSTQVGFSIFDQMLSSVTSLLVVVLLARSSTTEKFGRFSVIFAVYVVVLGICRALTTEPMAVQYGRLDEERHDHDPTKSVLSTSCLIGTMAMLVCAVPALLVPSDRVAWLLLGLALPGLMIQDACRYVLIAGSRAEQACVLDAIWLIGTLGLSFTVDRHDPNVDLWLTSTWLVCGVLSGLVGVWLLRRSLVGPTRGWLRRMLPLGWRFTLEFLAQNGSAQFVILVVGWRSVVEAAAVRGASTILAPVGVILSGAGSALIPRLKSPLEDGKRRASSTAAVVAGAACVLTVVCVPAAYFAPERLGRAALGASWSASRRLMPFLAIASLFNALAFGPNIVLRALGRANDTMRSRVAGGVLLVAAVSVGFALGVGLYVLATLLAIPAAVTGALLWRAVPRHTSDQRTAGVT